MYIYCSGCGGHFYIGFYRLWLKKATSDVSIPDYTFLKVLRKRKVRRQKKAQRTMNLLRRKVQRKKKVKKMKKVLKKRITIPTPLILILRK